MVVFITDAKMPKKKVGYFINVRRMNPENLVNSCHRTNADDYSLVFPDHRISNRFGWLSLPFKTARLEASIALRPGCHSYSIHSRGLKGIMNNQ